MMSEVPATIVFMGTPDFAVPSLEALYESDDPIVLVVTQPDRPKGRGLKLTAPPVKTIALSWGLPLAQPNTMKDPEFVKQLAELNPDLIVVVAYGLILPREVLDIPRLGTVNIHPSLLPRLRGAAPIQWSIISGDRVTGVTTMLMSERLDAGDILLRQEVEVRPDETAGVLHDRLADLGAKLLLKTVRGLKKGVITPHPQEGEKATYAGLLRKNDGLVRWSDPAWAICNLVRGLDPWPGAFTLWKAKRLELFGCRAVMEKTDRKPGEFIGMQDGCLAVATGEGFVTIREVHVEGRKRMKADLFQRGAQIQSGTIFQTG